MSLGKKIALILGSAAVLFITAGIGILVSKMNKIETVELDAESLSISAEVERDKTGYLNVALFGLDTRKGDALGTRSDTIIVASLNRETGEVRLCSVYRDTMLKMGDDEYRKANAAYFFEDVEGAVAVLNRNLDLDIEHYVSVDFSALIEVVDAVGGVDINVQEDEVEYLNAYIHDVYDNTGQGSEAVYQPGMQTLNGVQATAYARIRYTAGDDFRRTERQRAVIEQIVEKAQQSDLRMLNQIIDKVFPKIQTNFSLTEILAYAKDFKEYSIGATQGFPTENTGDTLSGIGSVVIPQTLESNVIELHKFLFGDNGYSPSSTVSEISTEIISESSSLSEDNSGYSDYGYTDYGYDDSYYNDAYGTGYGDASGSYDDTGGASGTETDGYTDGYTDSSGTETDTAYGTEGY